MWYFQNNKFGGCKYMKVYSFGDIGSFRQYIYPINEITNNEVIFLYDSTSFNFLHKDYEIDINSLYKDFAGLIVDSEISLDKTKSFLSKYGYIYKIDELIHKNKEREENGITVSYFSGSDIATIKLDDLKKEAYIFNNVLRLITLKQDILEDKYISPFIRFDYVRERLSECLGDEYSILDLPYNILFETLRHEGGRPSDIIDKLRSEYRLIIKEAPYNDSWEEISRIEGVNYSSICDTVDDLYNSEWNTAAFGYCGVFKLIDIYVTNLISYVIRNTYPVLKRQRNGNGYVSQYNVNNLLEFIYYSLFADMTNPIYELKKCCMCGGLAKYKIDNYQRHNYICGDCKNRYNSSIGPDDRTLSEKLRDTRNNDKRSIRKKIASIGIAIPDELNKRGSKVEEWIQFCIDSDLKGFDRYKKRYGFM